MTKTVTISAARANGDPYAHHDVIVTLIAGSAGGVVGSTVVVESSTVRLDVNGEGSIVLATNDTGVESPTGSFYRFTVAGSSPTITRSIELTDALPSTVSWTLAGIQVADPTDPQRDVSSDYVTIDGGSLTNYLAALGTGAGVPDVMFLIGTNEVDGTAATIATLDWDQNADASGLAPTYYTATATFAPTDLAAYLTGVVGLPSDYVINVVVPGGPHPGVYSFTPATIADPWTAVDALVATKASSDWLGASVGDGDSWLKINDAASVDYIGTGLLLGILKAHPGMHALEGILDRWSFDCGMSLTANVNIAATDPTLEYGGCVAGGRVFLNAQTTPSQNGHYSVESDLTLTRINDPDVFDPPGNGYRTTLVAPADPAHGLTLMWLGDDRTNYFRGGAQTQQGTEGDPGEWVVVFDPTAAGGGVALGETSTTAYRGDRGKTAYDYSQAHTGATDPHGDRAYAAALVDDLSGVTDASTARTNLGLGTLATASAVTSADITDATIVAGDLAASLLGRIPTAVVVSSDVSSPTDGTFTNTTGLSFSAVAGSTYFITGTLDVTGINAADLRVSLTCPAGTVRVAVWGKNYASTSTAADTGYSTEIVASGGIATNLAVITGQSTLVPFQGYFTCTTTGTFQIQHAQRSASATATVVKAGSYLTYHT